MHVCGVVRATFHVPVSHRTAHAVLYRLRPFALALLLLCFDWTAAAAKAERGVGGQRELYVLKATR